MSNSVKYTEKELNSLLIKNPKLKISKLAVKKNDTAQEKILIDPNKKTKIPKVNLTSVLLGNVQKKSGSLKTSELININKQATYECSYSPTHFSVLFKGARLLTINQIFAMLQISKRKFEVFSYKKSWHLIISNILNEKKLLNNNLPFFNNAVEVTLFRQAPRLVDEDALTTMFKYIIDAFKQNDENNPYGIIAEDNPKIVHRIISHSEKGEYYIGIRITKINAQENNKYLPEQILLNEITYL